MNLADLMLTGWKSIRGNVVPHLMWTAGAIILVGVAIHNCGEAKLAKAELVREREGAALVDHGVKPAIPVSEKEIRAALEEEKKKSAVLRASLADAERRIKAATGKAPKVIEVVKFVTIPGPAGGEPPPGRDCLVSKGDTLEIRGVSAKYETKGKNHVIAGVASCRRLLPLPATTIYEGPFSLEATRSLERRDPATSTTPRRWGVGPVGSIDTSGKWAVGPQVGLHFSRLDFSLGITFPDQRAIGAVMVRW
jgi:hypothetical protein